MTAPTYQTPETPSGPACALLIGVDDYKRFDGTGALDLHGSRNGVLLVAWYCLVVLRLPIKNIQMLIRPNFSEPELREFVETVQREDIDLDLSSLKNALHGALEEDVRSGLGWLLEETTGGRGVLFAFSGHGSWSEKLGPVLCLGDTRVDDATGELAHGVLPLRQLRARIEEAGASSTLIALLDCCHVTGPLAHARFTTTAIAHRGKPEDVAADDADFSVSSRVLLAAQPGKLAYQMRLGRRWHGAMTFALVSAAERWLSTRGVSNGSYRHVWKRTKETMKALEVPQQLEMRVPDDVWKKIREQPFFGVIDGDTVREPDAVGGNVQLDPNSRLTGVKGTVYDLVLTVSGAGQSSAALSVGTTSGSWLAGKEYWAPTSTFLTLWNGTWPTTSPTPTLSFSATTYTTSAPPTSWNGSAGTTVHASVMTGHWQASAAPPLNTLYQGNFGVTFNSSGDVTWYCRGTSPSGSSYAVSSAGATFTTTQPTSGSWWILTV